MLILAGELWLLNEPMLSRERDVGMPEVTISESELSSEPSLLN